MRLRHDQSRFRRAVNKTKRFAAAGLVSGLMVLGEACHSQKDQPNKYQIPGIGKKALAVCESHPKKQQCSLNTDVVRSSGFLSKKEAMKKWVSGEDISFNVKAGDTILRRDLVGLDENGVEVKGHTSMSVVSVDNKGILLRDEYYYCNLAVAYYRLDYKDSGISIGLRYISVKKTSDPETAKFMIKPGLTL